MNQEIENLRQIVTAIEGRIAALIKADQASREVKTAMARCFDNDKNNLFSGLTPPATGLLATRPLAGASIADHDQADRFMRAVCEHASRLKGNDDLFLASSTNRENNVVEVWKKAFGVKLTTTLVSRILKRHIRAGRMTGLRYGKHPKNRARGFILDYTMINFWTSDTSDVINQ